MSNNKIECYAILNTNRDALEKMAEFVATYRILMVGWSNHSFFHQQIIYDNLYRSHIDPLIKRLIPSYDKSIIKQLDKCIRNILDKLLSSTEDNDQWSINLIVASIQQIPNWWPPRRPLRHEFSIHINRNFFTFFRKTLNTHAKTVKDSNLTFDKIRSGISKRSEFIVEHIPEYHGLDSIVTGIIVIMSLTLALYLCVATEQRALAGLSFISHMPIIKLLMLLSGLRPSYLAYNNMPNKLNLGLVQELQECIQEYIPKNKKTRSEMSHRNKFTATHREYSALEPLPFISPPSYISTPPPSFYSKSSEDTKPGTQPPIKIKTTANQVSIPPSIETKETLNTCTWTTVEHGIVTYEEGRLNKDLVILWSVNQSNHEKYVTLYPRKKLKGGTDLITTMGETALVGRICRAVNQPGYVKIEKAQKECHKYTENALFKLKVSPQSIFAKYRALVTPSVLATNDKPTPKRPQLLEVQSPYIKTRKM